MLNYNWCRYMVGSKLHEHSKIIDHPNQEESASSMELLYTVGLLLIPAFLIFLNLNIKKTQKRQQQASRQPPGPSNLPIIGSIHHLFGQKLPHHALRDLSAVYGPIMRLKLGEIHATIISSAEAAREIMKTHDIAFASRPINTSTDVIFYGGNEVIFGPYGEFWRQMRRICTTELLSAKRVRSFRAVREEEVSYLIRSVAASSDAVVDLSSKLAETSNNVMARATIGSRCYDQQLFLSALEGAVEFTSGLTIVDLFPSMPFVGRITGFRRRLQMCQKKLDLMAEKIVEEHREKRAKRSSADDDEPLTEEDLTDVLLRIQRDGGLKFPLSNDNIKGVVNDMLLAGSETSATATEWVMSELVRNPAVMRKAQREVRAVLGSRGKKEKIAEEEYSTSSGLTYLQLVIKETLRLHPPAPLLLPRENQESCEVMGYEIPAKTTVMVNAWAIGRDPNYWDDAETFRPERFEQENAVDFKGAHFELIPFGAGRRICPGMQFGLATVEIVLANLLYYFDWEYPAKKGEELDMSDAFGVTTRRRSPLRLLATRRFPLPCS